jgi:hypothetical protein
LGHLLWLLDGLLMLLKLLDDLLRLVLLLELMLLLLLLLELLDGGPLLILDPTCLEHEVSYIPLWSSYGESVLRLNLSLHRL